MSSTWVEEAQLTASDAEAHEFFGSAVSILGNVTLVGSEGSNDPGRTSGSGYVYRYNGSSWVEETKLTAAFTFGNNTGRALGASASLFGNIAMLGALHDNENGTMSGSAYLYRHNGSAWIAGPKLTASDGAAEDWFGGNIAISGNTVVIGAQFGDGDESDSGSVYVFDVSELLPVPSVGPPGVAVLLGLLGLAGWRKLRNAARSGGEANLVRR